MLAIVIPYYRHNYFEETLKSLAKQTNQNFKVYIGDDKAPFKPDELINKYSAEINIDYKRFDFNLGEKSLSRQWERCIDMLLDETWFQILGDDDYLSPNFVEEFYKNIETVEKKGIRVVRYSTRVITVGTSEIKKHDHPPEEKATDFFYRKFFIGNTHSSLSEFIFKTEAYHKWGFHDFQLGWGVDNLAWLEFSDFGVIYSINDAFCYVRKSHVNISRKGYLEEIKLKTRRHYIELIVTKYLRKFTSAQQMKLLLFYENLTYATNQVDFKFWVIMNYYFIKKKDFEKWRKLNRRILSALKNP